MVNTKNKGQRKETLCANELKKDGYFIAFKACTVKRGPFFVGLDFGDVFDVVALFSRDYPEKNYKEIVWKFISCSFASHRAEKIAAVKKFKETYDCETDSHEYWVWIWTPARYRGRGTARHFEQAKWEKVIV